MSASNHSPGRRQQQPSSLESMMTIDSNKTNSSRQIQQQQQQQQRLLAVNPIINNSTTVGKRTGVIFPPRGTTIPLNDDGLENVDAFFAAAQSPPPPLQDTTADATSFAGGGGKSSSGSSKSAALYSSAHYGKRAEKLRQQQKKKEEERQRRQRQLEELEEEAAQNAIHRPDVIRLNQPSSTSSVFLPTPKQQPQPPSWSSRMLHAAMGIPIATTRGEQEGDDSPSQYSILSKVSTAAPSTIRKSMGGEDDDDDTNTFESRHAMRGKLNQESQLLEKVARMEYQQQQQQQNSPVNYDNNMDYSEDEDEGNDNNKNHTNKDDDDDDFHYDGPVDPPEEIRKLSPSQGGSSQSRGMDPDEEREVEDPSFDGGGGGYEENGDDFDGEERVVVAAKSSKAVTGSAASSQSSNALENSLEEVVDYHDRYDDDDNYGGEEEGGGMMQLATQQLDDNDDHSFGGGGGGSNDYYGNASQRSRGSSSREEEDEDNDEEVLPKKKKSKKDFMDKKQKKQQQNPVTPTSVLRTSKSKKNNNKKKQTTNRVNWSTPNGTSKGIPAGPREYEAIPVTDYKANYAPGEEPQTPGGSALRRSRRAKFKPLQFWKNEKLIYEAQNEEGLLGEAMGDMPVVAGVMYALPTPYKEVKRREREPTTKPSSKDTKKNKNKRKHGGDEDNDDEGGDDNVSRAAMEPFDDKALRKKYRIRNGESGTVWSETLESATDTKIVSRLDNRTFSKLPLSATRSKRESKVVGFASQSFHIPTDAEDMFPGYIAGNVVIPPRGIKDAEGVGLCSQVFTVGDCQPNSLELAVADPTGQDGEFDPDTAQRYLLSKGDMFQIPPGNVYRIENHSKKAKAALFWVIIKCMSKAEQDDEEDEEEEEDR